LWWCKWWIIVEIIGGIGWWLKMCWCVGTGIVDVGEAVVGDGLETGV
jgi:hypothetical protein